MICGGIVKNNRNIRILHTADWHLGKELDGYPRFDEQVEVMNEICDIADKEFVDLILIAGDLFDTFNPPTKAVDLFYKTLKRLSGNGRRAVVAIAGNHDSPDRIESPDPLARECGIIFSGYPDTRVPGFLLESGLELTKNDTGFIEIKLPDKDVPIRILLTPYANELRLKKYLGADDSEEVLRNVLKKNWEETAKKYCDNKGINILMTHLFVVKKGETPPDEPENERPILHLGGASEVYTNSIPKQIQYAAIGHLHRKQIIETKPCPVVYSGSPIAYSFSETDQKKYVMLIDIKPDKDSVIKNVELKKGKKLLRKKSDSIDELIEWLNDNEDALVELTVITEKYLKTEDKKRLLDAHGGIISIIPESNNSEIAGNSRDVKIDLSKNMLELFKDYFKNKKNIEPNNDILELFHEVIAEEVEK